MRRRSTFKLTPHTTDLLAVLLGVSPEVVIATARRRQRRVIVRLIAVVLAYLLIACLVIGAAYGFILLLWVALGSQLPTL